MKVTICSRKAIEEIIASGNFPENTAVISFCDLFDIYVDYSAVCDDVFYCELDDLDIDSLSEMGYTYDTFFPEVEELAEFINKAYLDGKDIICQCEHGESRSAACAAAILEYFHHKGIDVFANYQYCPSQLVYNKVFNALEGCT